VTAAARRPKNFDERPTRPQHATGITQIGQLQEALRVAGLQDQVTFAAYNVFGRTLKENGLAGRDHWGSHHTTLMIGAARWRSPSKATPPWGSVAGTR
jgi:uncharacterized protein DUF1501